MFIPSTLFFQLLQTGFDLLLTDVIKVEIIFRIKSTRLILPLQWMYQQVYFLHLSYHNFLAATALILKPAPICI